MSTTDDSTFGVRRIDDGDELVVQAYGELDISSCPELDVVLGDLVGPRRVVLDLSEITFIDSAGLRTILKCQQALSGAGGELVLRSPSSPARRLLQITGLEDVLAIDG